MRNEHDKPVPSHQVKKEVSLTCSLLFVEIVVFETKGFDINSEFRF
jgi:hypothetical protein